MSLDKINGTVGQYLVKGKSPAIGIDGKIKPWDYDKTNRNRITAADDRTSRGGWCYLGDGIETLTIGGSFSIDHIIADLDSGAGWGVDQDISGILSGRVLTFASGTSYKNIRAYITAISPANLRFRDVCEAEAGTVAFDQSDNGNDGTLSNASLHDNDSTVLFSHADDFGFRISGGAVVPIIEGTANCVDGNPADYRGACKPYFQLKNSPAASFAINDTLNFSIASPYSRPTSVTINKSDGVAAGSYVSGTGIFTFSTAGVVSSLDCVVGGVTYEVFLISNIGNFIIWKQNSIEFGITRAVVALFSTTNNHSFAQSKGATNYKNTVTSSQGGARLASSQNIGQNFELILEGVFIRRIFETSTPSLFTPGTLASGGIPVDIINLVPNDTTNTFQFNCNGGTIETFPSSAFNGLAFDGILNLTCSILRVGASVTVTVTDNDTATVYTDSFTLASNAARDFNLFYILLNSIRATATTQFTNFEVKNGSSTTIYKWTPATTGITAIVGGVDLVASGFRDAFMPSALDANGNSTGLDIAGNQIPNPELIGKTINLNIDQDIDLNPESMPRLTQMGFVNDGNNTNDGGTDSQVAISDLPNLLASFTSRSETANSLNDLSLNDRPLQPKLVLDDTTDSNTITFTAGSFAANGIVSATATEAKSAITLGTDSITITDGLELYYVRFLDGSGNVVEMVPCSEGSGTTIEGCRGLLTGTIGGTTTTVWQTQRKFDHGLYFGEEESGGVKYPGLVQPDFTPQGISAKVAFPGLDNLSETIRGQRVLKLTKKAI